MHASPIADDVCGTSCLQVLFSEREDGDTALPHERAIMEAAVCTSVAHRNVVATYHYDIKPVTTVDAGDGGGLQVTMAEEQAPDLLTTEFKLYLVQVGGWVDGCSTFHVES